MKRNSTNPGLLEDYISLPYYDDSISSSYENNILLYNRATCMIQHGNLEKGLKMSCLYQFEISCTGDQRLIRRLEKEKGADKDLLGCWFNSPLARPCHFHDFSDSFYPHNTINIYLFRTHNHICLRNLKNSQYYL